MRGAGEIAALSRHGINDSAGGGTDTDRRWKRICDTRPNARLKVDRTGLNDIAYGIGRRRIAIEETFEEGGKVNESLIAQIGKSVPDLGKRVLYVIGGIRVVVIKVPEDRVDGRFTPVSGLVAGRYVVFKVIAEHIRAVRTARVSPDRVITNNR